MSLELWTKVDSYIDHTLVNPDAALDRAVADSRAAGLPEIQVTPSQGKFLHILAKLAGARRILEVGTLGGYSTIWMARALPPDGKLISLELEELHVRISRANIARAGLQDRVEVRQGPALESLAAIGAELAAGKTAPFDLVFIDADKPNNSNYLSWALKLSRKGALIIVDNVVREGLVIDADSDDKNVIGVREMNAMIAKEPRLTASAVQTVGAKGYDGFAIMIFD